MNRLRKVFSLIIEARTLTNVRIASVLTINIFAGFALMMLLWPAVSFAQTDVTSQLKVTGTKPSLNSSSQTFDSTVKLFNKNKTKSAAGPLSLVVTKVSKPGVRLANAIGEIKKGRYIIVPLNGLSLAPNQSVSNIQLKFTNPKQIAFSYSVKVFSGALTDALPNHAPVAKAGSNQTVAIGNLANLDASQSTDFEGEQLSYQWSIQSKPLGSSTDITDSSNLHAALSPDISGRYVVQLLVNDGHQNSQPDTVIIDTDNSPPMADAGHSIFAQLKKPSILDGTQSQDYDGDTLSYNWTLNALPKGSKATLSNADWDHATLVPDKKGDYWARLIVNDGNEDSKPASVLLSTVNSKPVASIGSSGNTVIVSQPTYLNGASSTDSDGDHVSFQWSLVHKPQGSLAEFLDPWAVTSQFIPDLVGEYLAQLQVSDGRLYSDPAIVSIQAQTAPVNNMSPQITSQPVTTAWQGVTYQYTVAAVDPDTVSGDQLTYSLVTAPSGMSIGPNSGLIEWTPAADQVGSQSVIVTVQDSTGATDSQSFSIAVTAPSALTTTPNLIGLARSQTRSLLSQANLLLGNENFQHSASIAEGLIISQSVAANAQAAVGSAIDVVISTGPDIGLPPNPQTTASVLSPVVVPAVGKGTQFLYSGSSPVQTGVTAEAIQEKRAAVIRGKVLDSQNNPLSGVTITVNDHPEYGQTLSRADGQFDMAVNGGGILTVNYAKASYPPLQRQSNVPWQGYAVIDDVVMLALDSKVTTINLASANMQVAQGSPITDQDGSRQATLMIPTGTEAQIYLPNGTTQSVNSLNLHLTEYTVGANGPKAMPGPLPPASGYTYAIDLKAEEAAVSQNGTEVIFNQPVPFYVDNFLDFPIGEPAPLGYYDDQKAAWVAADSGRVIKIVNIANGLADIDSNGDGIADTTLGLTNAERQNLANLYPVGKSLWRVLLNHLSKWDINWGWSPPDDAISPNPSSDPVGKSDDVDDPNCSDGSIIECENQVLGEHLNLVGTGLSLNYRSNRQSGTDSSKITIPLSGPSIPASLRRIDLVVEIAGRRFTQSFSPSINASYVFNWDGLDPYGRPVFGWQDAKIYIGFVYPLLRQTTQKFGYNGNGKLITADRAVAESVFWKNTSTKVSTNGWITRGDGLGGWTLSNHHIYDPFRGLLYKGTGAQVGKPAAFNNVLSTFAGNGSTTYINEGGTATLGIGSPQHIVVAADGTVYFSTQITPGYTYRIMKVGADQKLKRVAGNGSLYFTADGIQAVNEGMYPLSLALTADGSLLVCDGLNHRLRKIGTDGIITTIAGNGTDAISGDGGPATAAALQGCLGLALASDGTIYFGDGWRIRRISTDGIISTFAGGATTVPGPDGGQASATAIGIINGGIAVAADGSVYFSTICPDTMPAGTLGCSVVRRVSPSGIISTVVGSGSGTFTGDGAVAKNAGIGPGELAFASDGALLIVDKYRDPNTYQFINYRIRRVDSDGIITTLAGNGKSTFSGEGVAATNAGLDPAAIAVLNDGGKGDSVFIADRTGRIRQIKPQMPEFNASDIVLASEDGSELYRFNAYGLHQQTINALTGAIEYTFSYDSNDLLKQMVDGYGKITTIERDNLGNPLSITGPYGQRTLLTLDANGYLSNLADPAGQSYRMESAANGLLTKFTDPNLVSSTFTYDPAGKLLIDSNGAGGSTSLARNGIQVTKTTALGRKTTFEIKSLTTSDQIRTTYLPNGSKIQKDIGTNGISATTWPDGTVETVTHAPDSRFGMSVPITSNYQIKTGGITSTQSMVRQVSLTNPNDPLTVSSLLDTININGRVATVNYNAASLTQLSRSPAGRTITNTVDGLGRLIQSQFGSLLPTTRSYDAQGRLISVAQGTGADMRSSTIAYNSQGYIASITDSLNNSVNFDYDDAGRVTRKTLADGRPIQFAYDAKGNLTSLTPPGRPAHQFTFTAVDLTQSYQPPAVNVSNNSSYAYNVDKQPTLLTRADGQSVVLGYDGAGRVNAMTYPDGVVNFGYDVTTGKLTSVTAADGGVVSDSYNGALKTQTAFSGVVAGTVGYSYDNDFAVSVLQVNGANNIAYSFDNDKLITKAGALSISRDAALGSINGTSLGVVTDARTLNSFGDLTNVTAKVNASDLIAWQYSYDTLGRIVQIQETTGATSVTYIYSYDVSGRLTEVSKDGVLQSKYTWDDNGNRLSYQGAATLSGQYDDQDRLLSYGNSIYGYSNNGDLQSKTTANATTNYQYDVLGNLKHVILPDGKTLDYLIDGYNRRIGKKVNGVQVQGFLYQDKLKLIAELDGANNLLSQFVYASRINVPDYMIKNGVTYRIITDHLGSPRKVVDVTSGVIAQELRYDEFGRVLYDSNPGFQPFGYAGGLYDKDTGLVRFGSRDYDAYTGRWTTKDPILFSGHDTNLYGYSWINPININDPFGTKNRVVSQDEVNAIINKMISEVDGLDNPIQAFLKTILDHNFTGKYDPKVIPGNEGDTFCVPGRGPMNAAEFGNYLAGYAMAGFGDFGVGATHLGGEIWSVIDPDPEMGRFGGDNPHDSDLIDWGAADFRRDYPNSPGAGP